MNGTRVAYFLSAMILSIFCLILLLGCESDKKPQTKNLEGVYAPDKAGKEAVQVKPLDDPNSPYAGQYEEWDYWIFANARNTPSVYPIGEEPDDIELIRTWVDPNGYMLPEMKYVELVTTAVGMDQLVEISDQYFGIWGEGQAEPRMMDEMQSEGDKVSAVFYPPIPKWLVDNPPKGWAMLLPNGEVVTNGMVSAIVYPGEDVGCGGSNKLGFYRYSASGELISTDLRFWWFCYYDKEKHGIIPPGEAHNRYDGYIYFTDPTDEDIVLSVWDYDGTLLGLTSLPPKREGYPFVSIRPKKLIR